MLAPDFVLQNRYRIVRLIAKGGMGAVYEATDQRLGNTVALKECLFDSEQLHRAFAREAQLLAGLRHQGLPKVTDHFSEGNAQFLVMEYIAGPDLAELLRQRGGPFPVGQVVTWADQLLSLLEYLHSQQPPIIHRDIKPQNLKLSTQCEIILLDFGLAKGHVSQTLSLTASSVVHGYSPLYSSIEQIRGLGSDARSDIYSTGATIYHLLTGSAPLDAVARAADLATGLPDQLVSAKHLNPEIPDGFSNLMDSMLTLNRDNRPATAGFLRRKLRERVSAELQQKAGYTTRSMEPQVNPSADTFRSMSQPIEDFSTRPVPSMQILPSAVLVTAPNLHSTAEETPRTTTPQPIRKKRSPVAVAVAIAISVLIVVGVVTGVALLGANLWLKGPRNASVGIDAKPKVVAPAPYDQSLKSVVALVTVNSAGNPPGHDSAFFVKDGQIAVPLGVIAGASSGYVNLIGNQTNYDLKEVVATDRDRGIAIVKVDGATAPPLPLSSDKPSSVGDKVVVLGSTESNEAQFVDTTITGYDKNNDLFEISSSTHASRGSVLVDQRGQAVAVVIGAPPDKNEIEQAIPIARIASLMKQKPQTLSLAVAGANEVLHDYRRSVTKDSPKLSPAAEQKILSAIFPRYLKKGEDCGDYLGSIAEARKAGQFAPSIADSATGSFTEAGKQQTAYIIEMAECGASHAESFGSKRLVVFENQKVVANVDTDFRGDIVQVTDMDQDGINEILLGGGGMGQGIIEEVAALADVKQGKFHILKDFGQISEDSCGSIAPKPATTAAVIFYNPSIKGQMPEFRMDVYRKPCKGGSFRYLLTGKFPQ